MHRTLESVQVASRPAIDGPLKVYVSLLALVLVVASPNEATRLGALTSFSALALDAAGRHYLRLLGPPVAFLVPSLVVILAVTGGGEVVVRVWLLEVTAEAVETAATTGLRSLAALSVMAFLVLSTPVPELFAALRRLRVPAFVVDLSLFVYRGIQILLVEADRLRTAAAARLGYVDRRTQVRTTKLVAGSLLVGSLERAERVDEAMRARCYDGRMPTVERTNEGYAPAAVVLGVLAATVVL